MHSCLVCVCVWGNVLLQRWEDILFYWPFNESVIICYQNLRAQW